MDIIQVRYLMPNELFKFGNTGATYIVNKISDEGIVVQPVDRHTHRKANGDNKKTLGRNSQQRVLLVKQKISS